MVATIVPNAQCRPSRRSSQMAATRVFPDIGFFTLADAASFCARRTEIAALRQNSRFQSFSVAEGRYFPIHPAFIAARPYRRSIRQAV